jgi:DNA-binding NarL/FixJ family response regulator
VSTRIGVVDDHPAFVLGLSAILNAQFDLQVVAVAPTAAGLIRERIRLDLVLIDLVLADGSDPSENFERLSMFGAPLIALTTSTDSDVLRAAAQVGADGALCKCEPAERIVDVVRRARISDDLPYDDGAERAAASAGLTLREAEVLALYASGMTADGVAANLFITRETVHGHIRRIRAKYASLGRPAQTRVDLFRRAIEDGLVTPETA